MVKDNIAAKTGKNDLAASDDSLLLVAENLKKGMMFTMNQIASRKVPSEKKLKWLKALTRQAEALVNVVEALNKIGSKSAADIDLATFLSSIEKKLPPPPPPSSSRTGPEPRRMIRALSQFREVTRRATSDEDDEYDEDETEEIPYGRGFTTNRRP